jgi:hypothetical protein
MESISLIIATLWKNCKEMRANRNNSIDPLSRYHAKIQNNTNILNLQIIYSRKANFPERLQQVLALLFEDHCTTSARSHVLDKYVFQKFSEICQKSSRRSMAKNQRRLD